MRRSLGGGAGLGVTNKPSPAVRAPGAAAAASSANASPNAGCSVVSSTLAAGKAATSDGASSGAAGSGGREVGRQHSVSAQGRQAGKNRQRTAAVSRVHVAVAGRRSEPAREDRGAGCATAPSVASSCYRKRVSLHVRRAGKAPAAALTRRVNAQRDARTRAAH
jgi:hypothetical protein